MKAPPISAIILAGGRAVRMGGLEKGLVPFKNKPLIQHVIDRLKPQVNEIFINCNREFNQYEMIGYPLLKDETLDLPGPLAGIQTGLKYANHALLLCVPCDSPLLPDNLVQKLLRALISQDADIAVARCNGDTQPVICLCKKTLLPSLNDYLAQGGKKVSIWQKNQKYTEVDFSENTNTFVNLNTHEELIRLECSLT